MGPEITFRWGGVRDQPISPARTQNPNLPQETMLLDHSGATYPARKRHVIAFSSLHVFCAVGRRESVPCRGRVLPQGRSDAGRCHAPTACVRGRPIRRCWAGKLNV